VARPDEGDLRTAFVQRIGIMIGVHARGCRRFLSTPWRMRTSDNALTGGNDLCMDGTRGLQPMVIRNLSQNARDLFQIAFTLVAGRKFA